MEKTENTEQAALRNRIARYAIAFTFAIDTNKSGDMQADIMQDLFKHVDAYKRFLQEDLEEKELLYDLISDYAD